MEYEEEQCEEPPGEIEGIDVGVVQDIFLDNYSQYLKTQSELSKRLLERSAIELEIVDCNFDLDKLLKGVVFDA
jgi:hypothetical protein